MAMRGSPTFNPRSFGYSDRARAPRPGILCSERPPPRPRPERIAATTPLSPSGSAGGLCTRCSGPLQVASEAALRSSISSPTLKHEVSQEAAQVQCVPEYITRKVGYRRSRTGGFALDAPQWQVEDSTGPVLPSWHRTLSHSLWRPVNPAYEEYGEQSEAHGVLKDPKRRGASVRQFMNPRDEHVLYTEAKFQAGNQAIMRKGGSTMGGKRDK